MSHVAWDPRRDVFSEGAEKNMEIYGRVGWYAKKIPGWIRMIHGDTVISYCKSKTFKHHLVERNTLDQNWQRSPQYPIIRILRILRIIRYHFVDPCGAKFQPSREHYPPSPSMNASALGISVCPGFCLSLGHSWQFVRRQTAQGTWSVISKCNT